MASRPGRLMRLIQFGEVNAGSESAAGVGKPAAVQEIVSTTRRIPSSLGVLPPITVIGLAAAHCAPEA